jgi:hypothetical protein
MILLMTTKDFLDLTKVDKIESIELTFVDLPET